MVLCKRAVLRYAWLSRLPAIPIYVHLLPKMAPSSATKSKGFTRADGFVDGSISKEASDDAKAMWSAYRSQLHSRVVGDGPPSLGLMSSTAGGMGQRLKRAPNMPKLGGPDDPGRLVKDWQYYCYHPKGTLHSSLNQYGTSMNSRWCATATPSSGRAAPPLRPTACTAYLPSTPSVHRTSRALHLAARTARLTACIPRVLQARPQPHTRDEASPGAYPSPEPEPEPKPGPEPEP